MAKFQSEFLNITAVQAGDLKTAPASDGSNFTEAETIEPHPGLVRLDINLFGKAVASMAPVFRLYRFDDLLNRWCKGSSFTVDPAITNTTTGEYRGLASIEIGNHKQAIVLEDCEIGATIRAVWRRVSNGSV